jgi:hypothetical protein
MKKVAFVLCLLPLVVHADGDKAAAQALFDEGRRLMAAGDFTSACPKFEASQELDPGLGTRLNIADCYEKKGQLAKAWGEWTDIEDEAMKEGDVKRQGIAHDRATKLQPKLPRLTINFAAGKQTPDGLVVKRDGEVVIAAMFGSPVPVDPGNHVITAEAPGYKPWSGSIDVEASQTKSFEVPLLMASSVPPPPPPNPDHPVITEHPDHPIFTPPPPPPGTEEPQGLSGQRKVAIAIGAVGAIGVVVGSIFGIGAISKWNEVKKDCNGLEAQGKCGGGTMNFENAAAAEKQANTNATISDVGFGVGIAAVVTAGILWFTDSRHKTEAHALVPTIGPDGAGVVYVTTF